MKVAKLGNQINEKELAKQCAINVVNCSVCKGTGKIKYQEIDEVMYSWQPWKTRDCSCKNYS